MLIGYKAITWWYLMLRTVFAQIPIMTLTALAARFHSSVFWEAAYFIVWPIITMWASPKSTWPADIYQHPISRHQLSFRAQLNTHSNRHLGCWVPIPLLGKEDLDPSFFLLGIKAAPAAPKKAYWTANDHCGCSSTKTALPNFAATFLGCTNQPENGSVLLQCNTTQLGISRNPGNKLLFVGFPFLLSLKEFIANIWDIGGSEEKMF